MMRTELVMGSDPHFVTTCSDGVRIAWIFCGSCLQHFTNCTHDMPTEPTGVLACERAAQRDLAIREGRPFDGSYLPTTVQRSERSAADHKNFGSSTDAGVAISDLVDDELVAKVKAATEARDA